jgi:DNA-binding response OmpR family regulator
MRPEPRVGGERRRDSPTAGADGTITDKPPKVLVADDDEDLCTLLRTNLEADGFVVLIAGDGRRALEIIESEKPDIVLLDIMMPVLDGYGVLERLSKDPHERTRVILITAKASSRDRLQGWELGADEFVTKPFDLNSLLKRVRKIHASSDREIETRRTAAKRAILPDDSPG